MNQQTIPILLGFIGLISAYLLYLLILRHSTGAGTAAAGVLATVGITITFNAYSPVADNAGDIAGMASLGQETRIILDSLDEWVTQLPSLVIPLRTPLDLQ